MLSSGTKPYFVVTFDEFKAEISAKAKSPILRGCEQKCDWHVITIVLRVELLPKQALQKNIKDMLIIKLGMD